MINFSSIFFVIAYRDQWVQSRLISGNRFLIAASSIPGGYYSAPNFFLQFKEFELYWGAVFFLRCIHTFFNDFDLSKRDEQVKRSGHSISLEAQSELQYSFKCLEWCSCWDGLN